jgi:hypothetical protein
MGTILASTIITDAAATLQDSTNKTWTRAELLSHLNDAQRDACLVKVDAYVKNESMQLGAGTRQALPSGGTTFIRLVCNIVGSVRGRAPRLIDIGSMDQQNPNWHSDPASSTVMEYAYDGRDPKHFYVSPPQPTVNPGSAEIVFGAAPPDITAENQAIALDDTYKTALTHYVIYRAYLKEGELSNNADALAHRAEFLALLGAKDTGEKNVEAA